MAKKTAPKTKKTAKPAAKSKAKPAKVPAKKMAGAKLEKKADKKSSEKLSSKALKNAPQKDVKLSAGKGAKALAGKAGAAKAATNAAPKAGAVMSKAQSAAALKIDAKGKKGGAAPLSGKAVKKAVSEASSDRKKAYDADVCREIACEGLSTTSGYCRLHYIKNWKKIKRKELILKEKKLNQYIEELVAKYPDKYIEAIRSDLADEKSFSKVIYDLELDEGIDEIPSEEESDDSIIESVKRDFDDTDTDF